MGLEELKPRGTPYRISVRGQDVSNRPDLWAGDDLVEASFCDRLRDDVERLKAELSKQIAASNNILDSEVDCDYRYEQGCLAALKRVQRFLDSEEE